MALPLAILLASLMSFGDMGEKLELLAMKSAVETTEEAAEKSAGDAIETDKETMAADQQQEAIRQAREKGIKAKSK